MKISAKFYFSLIILGALISSCEQEEPIPTYTLLTTPSPAEGGKILISPEATEYKNGETVTLTPEPNPHWVFQKWEGDESGNATPLSIIMNSNKSITSIFVKRDYPLTIKIEGEGTVKEVVISNPSGREYPNGTTVELTPIPNAGWIFESWDGDIDGNKVPQIIKIEGPKEVTVKFKKIELILVKILNPIDTLVISSKHKYEIEGHYSNGQKTNLSDSVTIEVVQNSITKTNQNQFTTGKSGYTKIKFTYKNFELFEDFYSSEIENLPIIPSEFLSPENCNIEVPIVLINLFPTTDGITHDDSNGPSNFFTMQNPILDKTKTKVYDDLIVTKNIVEYGTRFRDFGKNNVDPYACLKVVRIINVYEWKLEPWVNGIKTLNYKDLFEKIKLEKTMENTEFKEVWITHFPKNDYPSVINSQFNQPETYWGIPESNMASPTTGDISNSHRIPNDLPIYKTTYVVYGNSGHRGVDTNLHNRGHQIEAQLRYIEKGKSPNQELFWNNFVGVKNEIQAKNGRCGNTHFPPNANSDYDYCHSGQILSDIKTWKPSGGNYELVDCSTWTNLEYKIEMSVRNVNEIANYDKDSQTKWLLFWFQTIPGVNNGIPYSRDGKDFSLTNWWDLFFNWDEANKQSKNLWR